MKKYPQFVKMKDTVLRLEGDMYFRDAGVWRIGFKEENGKLLAVGEGYMPHANGIELIPATKEEWEQDNKGYTQFVKL
jgi:uncharacterized protein YegP (UPF0339 family)